MWIVSTNDVMTALWEKISPLNDEIPIYKRTVDENETNLPPSYLLIRADINNSPEIYGDGRALLRECDCDIMLISKTAGVTSDDIHNVNIKKVTALLEDTDAAYEGYDLGYNDSLHESQYTWNVRFLYGKETA